MLENLPQENWEPLSDPLEILASQIGEGTLPDISSDMSQDFTSESGWGDALLQNTQDLAGFMLPDADNSQDLDLKAATEFSSDLDSVANSWSDASQELSFTAAGRCNWCNGTGVVWSDGQNKKCPRCGGSGVGSI